MAAVGVGELNGLTGAISSVEKYVYLFANQLPWKLDFISGYRSVIQGDIRNIIFATGASLLNGVAFEPRSSAWFSLPSGFDVIRSCNLNLIVDGTQGSGQPPRARDVLVPAMPH